MNRSARLQLLAAIVVAFASGLVFASGFDLTRLSWAQNPSTPAPKPTPAEVRPLEETGQAFEAIAEHVTPAVVAVEAEQLETRRRTARPMVPPGFEDLFRNFDIPDPGPRSGTGSGFIVSPDGYILTNNHVVENADRVTVTLLDNRRFEATVVGRDPTTDVAVLKVDGKDLPTVTLGDDTRARIGQWVVAIGNPLGLEFTVTAGIVSAKGRSQLNLPNRQDYSIQDFIQTDAAINPGNSGGPLVNIRGEVIGINTAIASPTGFNAGYGFAIPITLAKLVMDDLIEYGRVRRAVLGVSIGEVQPADARAAGLNEIRGVIVEGFVPSGEESPARRAGMEPGDIIISVGGRPVARVGELQRVIRGYKPGDVVEIGVARFGERKTVRVRLGEAPSEEPTEVASSDRETATPTGDGRRSYERLGITARALPAELARAREIDDQYRTGLLVSEVSTRGPAYRSLIANRDVIVQALHPQRRLIRTAADLDAVVRSVGEGDVLSLLVYDMGVRQTRVVNIPIR